MKQDASCGVFAAGALTLHELTTTAGTKSDFSLFLSQGEVVVCYRWRSSGSRENAGFACNSFVLEKHHLHREAVGKLPVKEKQRKLGRRGQIMQV